MSARLHQRGFSYEVALTGEFRPAYLVAFADMGVRHAASSSVFLLPVQNGKGIPEIAAMLSGFEEMTDPTVGCGQHNQLSVADCQHRAHAGDQLVGDARRLVEDEQVDL